MHVGEICIMGSLMGGVGKIGVGPLLVPFSMDVLVLTRETSVDVPSGWTGSILIWMGYPEVVLDCRGFRYQKGSSNVRLGS